MAVRSGLASSFKPRRAPTGGRRPVAGRPASVPSLAAFTTRFTQNSTRSLFRRRGLPTCVSTVRSIAELRLFGGSGGGGDPAVALSKATLPWLPFRFPGKLEAFNADILNGFRYFYLTRRPVPPRCRNFKQGIYKCEFWGLTSELRRLDGRSSSWSPPKKTRESAARSSPAASGALIRQRR